MSKAKLMAAKELINEKQYDDARAILVKLDDPIAQKWLEKLDEIAPTKKPRTSTKPIYVMAIGLLIVSIVVAVFVTISILFANKGNVSNAPITTQEPTQSQQISLPADGEKALIQRVNLGVAGQVYKVEKVHKATDPSQFFILSGGFSIIGSTGGIIMDLPDELWCISSDTPVNVKVLTGKKYNFMQDVEGVTRFLVYRKGLLWNAVPSDSSKLLATETGMLYEPKDIPAIWLKAGCEW